MVKKLINPFEGKGKKKIISANDLLQSMQEPITEFENAFKSIHYIVNRNASIQEFQGLVNVYERNCQSICSIVISSEDKKYKWTIDNFIERCLAKFDFLYNTLLDDVESEDTKNLNNCARNYALTLFKLYIIVKLENKDELKPAYSEYNKAFSELSSAFMEVLKHLAEKTTQKENVDENAKIQL